MDHDQDLVDGSVTDVPPPPHTTFATREIHPPTFSAFKPRDYRYHSQQAITHVAWSCDGKRLAGVGIDKLTRVWVPEKGMDQKSASLFSGAHSDDVDYVSWNPTHPDLFCTSSQKDRRIVFWDARQSRHTQQCSLKVSPVQTSYSPDGRVLLYTSSGHAMSFLVYEKDSEDPDAKESWQPSPKQSTMGSTALFNHAGDGLVLTHHSEFTLRVLDYPSMALRESLVAHVGGCLAVAFDPRGRYMASGGNDSIVNLFDINDWICARTITSCEHSVNSVSFSHDGEYLAIASAGSYIDICATETAVRLHRITALAPAPTVTWHPSKYAIAYCGQTPRREGGPPPVAVVSLFGLME
ncbi:WD-REPEATS-REGION domain-containing protein [Mycena chlorophos]|uniref:WD-REPEATS-REGION domain-containing protein n=1 Tax=Mycena chlorophos TaxID=658473 RepID=A0A8H6VR20_MYCCL|nr:WD-REPEATS-REGION domain-containing protein [Mycena chlorophos]